MANNWILVRGLGRSQGHWGRFKELFLEAFSGDRIEFLDLKGNGPRCDEISYTSIEDFMQDIRSRSELVREGARFHLVAISLGGMVCAEWAQQYPDEVASVTLVCTSSSESPFYERFNLRVIPRFIKGALGADVAGREKLLLETVTNSSQRRAEELPGFTRYSLQHPMKISNFLRQIWAAARYKVPQKLPVPVYLIGSYGDKLVSPNCTLRIAQKWGVTPVMHPWAGHDVGVDDPDWLLKQLRSLNQPGSGV